MDWSLTTKSMLKYHNLRSEDNISIALLENSLALINYKHFFKVNIHQMFKDYSISLHGNEKGKM